MILKILSQTILKDCMQLELNFQENSCQKVPEIPFQQQLNLMNESMGKVRRKLFAEIGEVKKLYANLLAENESLKLQIRQIVSEKTEWVYDRDGFLFDMKDIAS